MKYTLKTTKLFIVGLILLSPFSSISQTPNPIADAVYDGWVDAYLINSGDGDKTPYFCQTLANRNRAFFWQQAYLIWAVEDAYDRAPSESRKQFVSDLLNKLIIQDLKVWTWDSWNDDLQWAMIACMRGYQITGNTLFRDVAVDNWNRVWARGWDNTFDGGIWEDNNQIPNGGKCGLSNWPQIIAGTIMVEALATSDPNTSNDILNKCKQIYSWGRTHLWDPNTGRVYEGYYPDATRNFSGDDNSYNYGLLTNSAASLYRITKDPLYYNDAVRVADRNISKINTFSGGIMREDKFWNGGFGAEQFARGLAILASENYLWNKYLPFLSNNCAVAWSNRRTDYNFTQNDFATPTPTSGYDYMAMELTGGVTIQQVTPVLQSIPNTIQAENYSYMKGVSTEPSSDSNGNRVVSWIDANDWMDYIINVPTSGTYTLSYRVAGTGTGSVSFLQNGVTLATTSLPPTGDWVTWTTVSTTVNLTAGIQSIRLLAKANGWNLNWWSATTTSCTAIPIVPYANVNGVWRQTPNSSINVGGTVSFGPQPTTGGTWNWSDPNGFTSTSREVTIANIQTIQFGSYRATYTNGCGVKSSMNFTISNASCTPTAIVPYVSTNGTWSQIANSSLNTGGTVIFGPQPTTGGTWSWTGSKGYSSNSREITIANIQPDQGGIYSAAYTNACGGTSMQLFYVAVNVQCPATVIGPYVAVNGTWSPNTNASIEVGQTLSFGPQPTTGGTWSWSGPSGFTASSREVTIANIQTNQAGVYTATYTNSCGTKSTQAFNITVTLPCVVTAIIPYLNVNNGGWQQASNASLALGGTINFGPHPVSGGSWSWAGPNGFTASTREITRTNIQVDQFGVYLAKYTNACGAQSTQNFTITNSSVPVLFQAENAAITNGSINSGATGQYVDLESGGKLVWNVTTVSTGNYTVAFNVGVPSASTRNMGLYANNTKIGVISSNVVGFSEKTIAIPLNQGNNVVELRDSEGTAELNVDYLRIASSGSARLGVSDQNDISGSLNDDKVQLYPNPLNNGILHVEFPDQQFNTLSIFTSTGSLVYSTSLIDKSALNIDVSHFLTTGMYIVSLNSNNNVSTKKLMVK